MLLTLLFMVLVLVEPFKENAPHTAITYTVSTFLLALYSACVTGIALSYVPFIFHALAILFSFLPIIYIAVTTLVWVYSHRSTVLCLCPWKQGYQALVSSS